MPRDSQLGRRLNGSVVRISSEPIAELPEARLGDRSIAYTVNPEGAAIPDVQVYPVTLKLEEATPDFNHNSLGTVHIATGPRTLFQSLRRFLDQNLRPQL